MGIIYGSIFTFSRASGLRFARILILQLLCTLYGVFLSLRVKVRKVLTSLNVPFSFPDELARMFSTAGLVEEQNHIDRRLQVNRGRQLRMYRVWIQCKYRKPR